MLMSMLDEPDFIHELYAAHTQLVIDLFEGMRRAGMEFDGAFLADDLGYQAAPLISPALYRQLVMPHHKRLCDHFASAGLKTFLHSDGRVTPLIPLFLEAGFAGLHPLEAKAGLDVRDLVAEYGNRLVWIGNIDVRKLSGTRAEIEDEIIPKVLAARRGGGYIYHSDHSVPNSVSLESYRYAIELVRRYGAYD
jgi:uroporphyrinogen decarboxylase